MAKKRNNVNKAELGRSARPELVEYAATLIRAAKDSQLVKEMCMCHIIRELISIYGLKPSELPEERDLFLRNFLKDPSLQNFYAVHILDLLFEITYVRSVDSTGSFRAVSEIFEEEYVSGWLLYLNEAVGYTPQNAESCRNLEICLADSFRDHMHAAVIDGLEPDKDNLAIANAYFSLHTSLFPYYPIQI